MENDAGALMDKKDRDFMPKRPSKPGGIKGKGPFYKRSVRCHQCERCLRPDCGKCKNCRYVDSENCFRHSHFKFKFIIIQFSRDMPKFGGKGLIKQACE